MNTETTRKTVLLSDIDGYNNTNKAEAEGIWMLLGTTALRASAEYRETLKSVRDEFQATPNDAAEITVAAWERVKDAMAAKVIAAHTEDDEVPSIEETGMFVNQFRAYALGVLDAVFIHYTGKPATAEDVAVPQTFFTGPGKDELFNAFDMESANPFVFLRLLHSRVEG